MPWPEVIGGLVSVSVDGREMDVPGAGAAECSAVAVARNGFAAGGQGVGELIDGHPDIDVATTVGGLYPCEIDGGGSDDMAAHIL
ncbi:MAG: hypothetical protein GY753_18475 [Gammaproteobacteria bacterium]|nr:hypothetical protein [Gammaproteobacteria bacterium]